MALLIDGYNLLHVTGLVGRAGSGLQGSREALLRFLAAAIDAKERAADDDRVRRRRGAAGPAAHRDARRHDGPLRLGLRRRRRADRGADRGEPRAAVAAGGVERPPPPARRPPPPGAVRRQRRLVRRRGPPPLAASARSRRGAASRARRTLSADEIAYWLAEFADAPTTNRRAEAQDDVGDRAATSTIPSRPATAKTCSTSVRRVVARRARRPLGGAARAAAA